MCTECAPVLPVKNAITLTPVGSELANRMTRGPVNERIQIYKAANLLAKQINMIGCYL